MGETVTMTLTEFLLARIAEDEAAARAGDGEPTYPHHGDTAAEETLDMALAERCAAEGAHHFRRWMPARVLAECEAKRQIVALHEPVDYSLLGMTSPNACSYCGADLGMSDWEWEPDSFPCLTLRIFAAIYADHPDYNPEWRP